MFEMSESVAKLAAALAKAQGEMGGAVKDAANPAFKSKYATLEAVIDAVKPALSANGIAYVQAPGEVGEAGVPITTVLVHGESGEWMRSTLTVPLGNRRDAQGVGSAISYGRRYSLMSVLGIAAEDDDGNAASEGGNGRSKPPEKDWRNDADHAETLIRGTKSISEFADLMQTPWIVGIAAQAPKHIADRLRAAATEQKAKLTNRQEAA